MICMEERVWKRGWARGDKATPLWMIAAAAGASTTEASTDGMVVKGVES